MVVLSLFDGASCGLQALKNLGIQVDHYFAAEIDPSAIKISKKNHPEIIHLGDVRDVKTAHGELLVDGKRYKVDLLLAGIPCQGFSLACKCAARHVRELEIPPKARVLFPFGSHHFHLYSMPSGLLDPDSTP